MSYYIDQLAEKERLKLSDLLQAGIPADPMIDRRNAELAQVIGGTTTQGNWSRGQEGRPTLTMRGPAPVVPTQQDLDKQFKANARAMFLDSLMKPVWNPDGSPNLEAENANKAKLFSFLQNEGKPELEQEKLREGIKHEQQQLANAELLNKMKLAEYSDMYGGGGMQQNGSVVFPLDNGAQPPGAQQQAVPSGVNGAQYRKEMAGIAAKEASAKIPGTTEYKRIQDEDRKARATLNDATNTRKYAKDTADSMERNIADLMGVQVGDLPKIFADPSAAMNRVAPAVGSFDAMTPTFLQNATNIQSHIDALKNKGQMFGLTNLRKSGVAPGTVTEREWPKFEAMLGNIDPRLGEAEFVKQIRDIYAQVKSARESGELDYQQLTSGLPQSMIESSGGPSPAAIAGSKSVSMEDVFATAKASKKDINQVANDLKAKGYTIRGM